MSLYESQLLMSATSRRHAEPMALCHGSQLPAALHVPPWGPYLFSFVPLAPLLSWLPDLSLWEDVERPVRQPQAIGIVSAPRH